MLKKKIWSIVLFILLLIGMSYFPYLPIKIFNLDSGNFTKNMMTIYTLCCDIGFMFIIFLIYRKNISAR